MGASFTSIEEKPFRVSAGRVSKAVEANTTGLALGPVHKGSTPDASACPDSDLTDGRKRGSDIASSLQRDKLTVSICFDPINIIQASR